MKIESITLSNFRCFGPGPATIRLGEELTAFVGANGAGKTAVMQALARMFGVAEEQRRLRRADFHVPVDEATPPTERSLYVEVVLVFPELVAAEPDAAAAVSVPQFFEHMAASDDGALKCRIRLEGSWTSADGSAEGTVEQRLFAIRTLEASWGEDQCSPLGALDRARVQVVYVPATRDAASQVTSLLKGRLWRAIEWSEATRQAAAEATESLNGAFAAERAVGVVGDALERRWREVHGGGTMATPVLRPIDRRFDEIVRRIQVLLRPSITGQEVGLDHLSDGQKSLFHIAMTAAALDVEAALPGEGSGFRAASVVVPALTVLAVEEPENCLAPFYLSRVVRQLRDVSRGGAAQALVSSHSASIIARIEPEMVRHFRLDEEARTAVVSHIRLPPDTDEAGKFVREAVKAYPELYFARFVILGEGSSEEVVLPRLAEAMDLDIDRSFAAVVPLGGRHVNHLWKLIGDLRIPYATLLDLDLGRSGGGWGRVAGACRQLIAAGHPAARVAGEEDGAAATEILRDLAARPSSDREGLRWWAEHLESFGVFFSAPLDLDLAMLQAFPDAYRALDKDERGPSPAAVGATNAVLGADGDGTAYEGAAAEDDFRWYRYLFLGRGKPATHLRALSRPDPSLADLRDRAPPELRALLRYAARYLEDGAADAAAA